MISTEDYYLDDANIALSSDVDTMYQQIVGFEYQQVTSNNVTCSESNLPVGCKYYYDTSSQTHYNFYYPDDETIQYLYESYPNQISPIEGVTNEHFIVWMRTAALPTFRKLYGKISGPFSKGDVISLNIVANYEVTSFGGTKSLILTNLGSLGAKNLYIRQLYLAVGIIFFLIGLFYAGYQYYLKFQAQRIY